jgi:hypothetical protein
MLYFMRRAIGTLVEFDEALRRLSGTTEFLTFEARHRESNDASYLKEWLPALDFFRQQRKRNVRPVRGHPRYPRHRYWSCHLQKNRRGSRRTILGSI